MKQRITIHAGEKTGTLNPNMWGIFYEEINHAGDGGLYAELIQNRNFAASDLPEGTVYSDGKVMTRKGHAEKFDVSDPLPAWKLRLTPGAEAVMSKTAEQPRNPKAPAQLKLTVLRVGGGVRAVNSGYWGISVKRAGYHGFVIARAQGISKIYAGLMRTDGVTLCKTALGLVGERFAKLEYTLECPEEVRNARFFIETDEPGTLFLDFVSLFPDDTYKGRKYGLRADLAEKLEALKPGFLRFPGGCVVEGIDLGNAIHWKKTIGPIEDRSGHWDLWQYRCTDGLGMHEFLELCEDLGADGMYVVNCGMSCQFRSSEAADEAQTQAWLQNALDGVEYAIGPADRGWGAERAKNGHPAPFPLKYVEIGNENNGEEYFRRYRIFYQALREKYPQLTLIANCPVPDAPNDMVDDHYYTAPQTFPLIADEYERRGGGGPKIYVGEYACNQEVGYGNLLSAVSEAAFMIGMERSCDKVRMASYAPLFCNVNNREWPVNLINFDGASVFGIPSYYVQKVFSHNRPQTVVKTDLEACPGATSRLFATAGLTEGGRELIVKVACFGGEAVEAEIRFESFDPAQTVDAIRIGGESGTETNSLLDPEAVRDRSIAASSEGSVLSAAFPACSLTVFRIRRA